MEQTPSGDVRCGRIRITATAIEEVVERRPLVSIPRAEVRRLVLRHARMSERPLVMLVLGATLTLIGAWSLRGLLDDFSLSLLRTRVFLAILVVAGPLLIAAALRRGVVLDVETERTTRRLIVGGGADRAQRDHLEAAARGIGWGFETDSDMLGR